MIMNKSRMAALNNSFQCYTDDSSQSKRYEKEIKDIQAEKGSRNFFINRCHGRVS